jgi:hypothetical protein
MYKNYFLFAMQERKNIVLLFFFLSFGLVYKYVRKTVVQHKTIKRIKFVGQKQSGFFYTFTWCSQRTRKKYAAIVKKTTLLFIHNIKFTVTFTVQPLHNKILLEIVQSWHLFDDRQFLRSQFILPKCLDHLIERVERVAI